MANRPMSAERAWDEPEAVVQTLAIVQRIRIRHQRVRSRVDDAAAGERALLSDEVTNGRAERARRKWMRHAEKLRQLRASALRRISHGERWIRRPRRTVARVSKTQWRE